MTSISGRADVGRGITLHYESFGDDSAPTVVLIMGLGAQMLLWHVDLCQELARRGYRVVRFDNRDIGLSTRLDHIRPTPFRKVIAKAVVGRRYQPAYTLGDMAADTVGLLDVLEVDRAHVVGASMGGMIAQTVAARHPDRVHTLTSIMSATGNRWHSLPTPRAVRTILQRPEPGREGYQAHFVKVMRAIGGSKHQADPDELHALAGEMWDRGPSPQGFMRQLAAIIDAGNREAELRRVRAPALVIHGNEDPLLPVSAGKRTAKIIPDARLLVVDGMGHGFSRQLYAAFVDEMDQHMGAAAVGV